MLLDRPSLSDPPPPDEISNRFIEFAPKPEYDSCPPDVTFGDVVVGHDVKSNYSLGLGALQVVFHSSNPRNDPGIKIEKESYSYDGDIEEVAFLPM